jgi:hypothetical protein
MNKNHKAAATKPKAKKKRARGASMSERTPEAGTAHLEVQRVAPEWAMLPITETGYRSHFLPRGTAENAGGPVAYVKAWLEEAAKAPDWKRREAASRQPSLF